MAWSGGPGDTKALGERLGAGLRPGDVVHVRGELGSGKTTLIRGACRALGVQAPVTSPTFALAHRYAGDGVLVGHVDLYRLGDLAAEEDELLGGYAGPDTVTFVEWPAQGDRLLGSPRMTIALQHAGGDRRRIEIAERA